MRAPSTSQAWQLPAGEASGPFHVSPGRRGFLLRPRRRIVEAIQSPLPSTQKLSRIQVPHSESQEGAMPQPTGPVRPPLLAWPPACCGWPGSRSRRSWRRAGGPRPLQCPALPVANHVLWVARFRLASRCLSVPATPDVERSPHQRQRQPSTKTCSRESNRGSAPST